MLLTSSATFDERLIQRCGSGETENSSSRSGLATPQDEDMQVLGSVLDLSHAAKIIANGVSQQPLLQSHKGHPSSRAVMQKEYPRTTPAMTRAMSLGSMSSLSQSPEFETPEVMHRRARGVYTLPNRHISIEINEQHSRETVGYNNSEREDIRQPCKGIDTLFSKKWTRNEVCKAVLRFSFFLPWCIAVGGSIVLCPDKLDTITFRTGYLEPLFGIHRFAHWADRAFEHIVIFLTFLGFLGWLNPLTGVLTGCAVAALALNAWCDFRLDPKVPLGKDDRQSIYLSVTRFWLTDEFLNLRREDKGFMLDERSGPTGNSEDED
ncbi:hypothetical protein Ac2012v2_006291 [Leucoagaricus gongylophorus]